LLADTLGGRGVVDAPSAIDPEQGDLRKRWREEYRAAGADERAWTKAKRLKASLLAARLNRRPGKILGFQ
jgi:hypothetical protein